LAFPLPSATLPAREAEGSTASAMFLLRVPWHPRAGVFCSRTRHRVRLPPFPDLGGLGPLFRLPLIVGGPPFGFPLPSSLNPSRCLFFAPSLFPTPFGDLEHLRSILGGFPAPLLWALLLPHVVLFFFLWRSSTTSDIWPLLVAPPFC